MAGCFNSLLLQGRILDEGINNLEKVWSAPHIHIGRFVRLDENEENLEEGLKAKEEAEVISKSAIELKENCLQDLKENENNLSEMRQFLDESKSILDNLVQQCSDIETLFVENGYVPEMKNETENSSEFADENNSIIANIENPEVESTPYIPWKSKLKTANFSTPEVTHLFKQTEVKKEFSQDFETSLSDKLRTSRISYRSYRQSPREPTLSRYFYELVKEE